MIKKYYILSKQNFLKQTTSQQCISIFRTRGASGGSYVVGKQECHGRRGGDETWVGGGCFFSLRQTRGRIFLAYFLTGGGTFIFNTWRRGRGEYFERKGEKGSPTHMMESWHPLPQQQHRGKCKSKTRPLFPSSLPTLPPSPFGGPAPCTSILCRQTSSYFLPSFNYIFLFFSDFYECVS